MESERRTMLKTQEELLRVLDENSIAYTNHQHPAVYTVEQAALYHDGIDGVHSKKPVFKRQKEKPFPRGYPV
jgi:Ala-tRNA(Pro) deacylase